MKLTAVLQDIKHNGTRYRYAATARGKQGQRTRCRSFVSVSEYGGDDVHVVDVRIELTIKGRCRRHTAHFAGHPNDNEHLRELAIKAATRPEMIMPSAEVIMP